MEEAADRAKAELGPGEVLVTLGAGNVWMAGEQLLAKLRGAPHQPGSRSSQASTPEQREANPK